MLKKKECQEDAIHSCQGGPTTNILANVKSSYMEDVVGMETTLAKRKSVKENVARVCKHYCPLMGWA